MHVRLARIEDLDEIVAMARVNAETRPTLRFNEVRCRATFVDYLRESSPTFFVAEHDGRLYGFLVADYHVHRAFDGIFTVQEVLFVKPEKRGTRAAALLMNELVAWSRHLGANEIIGGVDNETNCERTAHFLERFGFKRVGFAMRRESV